MCVAHDTSIFFGLSTLNICCLDGCPALLWDFGHISERKLTRPKVAVYQHAGFGPRTLTAHLSMNYLTIYLITTYAHM